MGFRLRAAYLLWTDTRAGNAPILIVCFVCFSMNTGRHPTGVPLGVFAALAWWPCATAQEAVINGTTGLDDNARVGDEAEYTGPGALVVCESESHARTHTRTARDCIRNSCTLPQFFEIVRSRDLSVATTHVRPSTTFLCVVGVRVSSFAITPITTRDRHCMALHASQAVPTRMGGAARRYPAMRRSSLSSHSLLSVRLSWSSLFCVVAPLRKQRLLRQRARQPQGALIAHASA
jgi:hypothetical protein